MMLRTEFPTYAQMLGVFMVNYYFALSAVLSVRIAT